MSQGAYYLSTTADEIVPSPRRDDRIRRNISYKPMYMKSMFDKIGVDMQIVRGTGQSIQISAVEPFMYDEMSAANELQIQSSRLIRFYLGAYRTNEISAARSIEHLTK